MGTPLCLAFSHNVAEYMHLYLFFMCNSECIDGQVGCISQQSCNVLLSKYGGV